MKKPDNPFAFPRLGSTAEGDQEGMTLRDWFAGQAIPAVVSKLTGQGSREEAARAIAEMAFIVSDAMLAERERKQ